MSNVPDDPTLAVRRDVVEGVRALLDTFGPNDDDFEPGRSSGRLASSLQKLQERPSQYTTYLMIAFASVTIRWAAHETGRGEIEILDELATGFGVT
jgi:hypothetical protein